MADDILNGCQEEAGIPAELTLKGIKSAGAVSYKVARSIDAGFDVLSRAVLFVHDLELPSNFQPKVIDGEG